MWSPSPEGEWQAVGGDDVVTAPDFLALGEEGAFDSHIIFAGAHPFQFEGEERIYYMGGNVSAGGESRSLCP